MLTTCQGGGRQKDISSGKFCPEEASEHYQIINCLDVFGHKDCLQLPSSLQWVLKQWASCPADSRAVLAPSPDQFLSSQPQTPPHPWCSGTEAFVGRKGNIAAAPGPGCIPWQCTWGIWESCAFWEGKLPRTELRAGRRGEQTIPREGVCRHSHFLSAGWHSCCPLNPPFLPFQLDSFCHLLMEAVLQEPPCQPPGWHTDQLLSLGTAGAARAVTNRPSLHSSVTSCQPRAGD